jgi:hypothetical protein
MDVGRYGVKSKLTLNDADYAPFELNVVGVLWPFPETEYTEITVVAGLCRLMDLSAGRTSPLFSTCSQEKPVGWAMSFSPDSRLTMKALKKWHGKPVVSLRRGDVPQRSRQSLYEQAVPAVTVAIPDQAEYESAWKLLG